MGTDRERGNIQIHLITYIHHTMQHNTTRTCGMTAGPQRCVAHTELSPALRAPPTDTDTAGGGGTTSPAGVLGLCSAQRATCDANASWSRAGSRGGAVGLMAAIARGQSRARISLFFCGKMCVCVCVLDGDGGNMCVVRVDDLDTSVHRMMMQTTTDQQQRT